jgi:hypothetical protein
MSHSVTITAAFLDRILGLLAPLFLAATGGDVAAARDAVSATLAGYHIRNDNELRLVALSIAFGFGALDALSQAAGSNLPLNQVMRLRSNATALSRAGHQNEAVLDKVRKQTASEPAPEPEPAKPLSPATSKTPESVAVAPPVMQVHPQAIASSIPQSRQQRRATERQAEKARRRQEHEARRAATSAKCAATAPAKDSIGNQCGSTPIKLPAQTNA